jgi:D-alanyl-D-alanine carboxypeptidase
MKKLLILISLLLPLLGSAQLQTVFQHKVDSIYEKHRDAIGIVVHVESPSQHISWSYAKGVADTQSNAVLDSKQPVLIASNTKPYVAATILRLAERGQINLEQPIQDLLSSTTRELFEAAGYDLDMITVKQLLSHTSGIRDYVDEDYFALVGRRPDHVWQKEEQMERAIETGAPQKNGEKFSYGDINYLLLTEIIEQKTHQPFYVAMRELLKYKELGLNQTWFINLEDYPVQTLPLAHQYAGQISMGFLRYRPIMGSLWWWWNSGNSKGCRFILSVFVRWKNHKG